MPPLILASSSRYRAELLQRLGLPFEQIAPRVFERAQVNESAEKLAARLARAKAEAVCKDRPDAWILGSDQAAGCLDRVLGKPGNREAAREQLAFMAGRSVAFVTALSLTNSTLPRPLTELDVAVVKMRRLSRDEIDRYTEAEPAFDCAGSFKMEGLGISLFDEVQSRDPTGLMGLPLIATARLLRKAGYTIP